MAVVVVKGGPSGKRDPPTSWVEQDEEVSFVASNPRGDRRRRV